MRFLKRLFLLCLLLALGAGGLLAWFALSPLPLRSTPLDFTIESGMSLKKASIAMEDAGLGFRHWQFQIFARALRQAAAIKAGSYEVEQGVTPWQLLQKLTRGDVTQSEIRLVEGKTFRQFRAALDASPDLRHDTTGLNEAEIMQRIGAAETHPEGLFLPDTYLFAKHSSDLAVLRRAYLAMQSRYAREWAARAPNLPYRTPYEGLIMASIVEKETGVPTDRPMVASVFVNRLRAGMLLQTDPSVIYGLGEEFDGNIRKRDLGADNPYNTYTRTGLPPTPIAMPGLAAIQAALHPPPSDKYYFVARGDGSSQFSRTLDEHNRAVSKYILRKGH
ncbi:MAG TPA: endolytic transglycosylase MltG [Rhodocyclaceae bacterium]|nr:endolytic transglycosylase MltG [Rhodocyclaceae bacterium]